MSVLVARNSNLIRGIGTTSVNERANCVPPTMQTQTSALKLQLTKHGIAMTLRTARRIHSAIVANARLQLTKLGITRLCTTRRIHSAIVASTSIEHG
jgi:hypothetical protein